MKVREDAERLLKAPRAEKLKWLLEQYGETLTEDELLDRFVEKEVRYVLGSRLNEVRSDILSEREISPEQKEVLREITAVQEDYDLLYYQKFYQEDSDLKTLRNLTKEIAEAVRKK